MDNNKPLFLIGGQEEEVAELLQLLWKLEEMVLLLQEEEVELLKLLLEDLPVSVLTLVADFLW